MSTAKLGVAAGGGGGGGSVKIPPSAMEVVRSLKEIVENSDDEIYATLKECNMDLNETAQRLLNQGVIALTCFFSAVFFVISIFAVFSPLSPCEVVFSVSVAKSLALWFVSSVRTTLSVFSAARQNLKTTIFCLFTRRAQLSLTGNCESISFRSTVPLGCFRTIAERKSNVSGYHLQNGAQLYVLLQPCLLLNSTYSVTPGACMDNVACSHLSECIWHCTDCN